MLINKTQRIAFITSPQLGDALITMVTAHNLCRNNYAVTIFSDYLYELRVFFPTKKSFLEKN